MRANQSNVLTGEGELDQGGPLNPALPMTQPLSRSITKNPWQTQQRLEALRVIDQRQQLLG